MSRGLRKALRTIVQLVAGGSLTALVTAIADGLDPNVKAIVLAGFTVAVTYAQNALEAAGKIPVLLPSAPASATEAGVAAPPPPVVEDSTPQ
jgi:hypothetical protein